MANLGVIVLLLLPFAASVHGVPPPLEFIYGDCSPTTYAPESAFARNLYSLLLKLVDSAYNFTMITSPSQSDVVHGLYQCRGDLSQEDCSSCVRRSVAQLCTMCPVSSAAAIHLQGCYLKYDNASFLGVQDTSVIYKKLVPSVGYDYRKAAAWDAVLAGLLKGDNDWPYYRVASSKNVRGVAQCVGDLSANQCQNCVSEAVNQLTSQGGPATYDYGDMFLGKCYAQVSVGGPGDYSNQGETFTRLSIYEERMDCPNYWRGSRGKCNILLCNQHCVFYYRAIGGFCEDINCCICVP